MKTLPLGSPFLGQNNRAPDFALHVPKVGDFVRSALNVDIDNKGSITRRNATALVQTLTDAHSLHLASETTGFVVIASALYAITLPTYTQTLVKVCTSAVRCPCVSLRACLRCLCGSFLKLLNGAHSYPMFW